MTLHRPARRPRLAVTTALVEDLKRDRASIAGGDHRGEVALDVSIALTGHEAMHATDSEQIAVHSRLVAHLHDCDLVCGYASDDI